MVGMQKDSLRSPLAHQGAPLRNMRRSAHVGSRFPFNDMRPAAIQALRTRPRRVPAAWAWSREVAPSYLQPRRLGSRRWLAA